MRVQDFKTQEVIEELQLKEIPAYRLEEVKFIGENFEELKKGFPLLAGTKTIAANEFPEDSIKENV